MGNSGPVDPLLTVLQYLDDLTDPRNPSPKRSILSFWVRQGNMPVIDFKPITIADLLKLLGAITVFGLGLYQYAQAQKWKRREFVAAQIKDFEGNKDIQIMMTILDWTDRKV